MSYRDAIKATSNGVVIDFKVKPGSKRTEIPDGYDESRKRIFARLSAKAVDGKANKQLVKELSRLFGINSASIHLNGAASTKKSIELSGIGREDAIRILLPFFNDDIKNEW